MQRRGVAWLLASAALLCCPSAAQGSIDAALKTFNGAWPQGCAQVTIEQAEDVDPAVSGFATPGTCVVYLTRQFLAQDPAPEVVCAVVVHEFGHLLRLDHSEDESNIMFPSPLPPAACKSADASASSTDDRADIADATASAGGQQRTTGTELLSSRSCPKARASKAARARASSKRSSAKRSSASRRARRSACR